ncbi:hypothetical protein GCM10010228_32570 [Streptomyces massasporeus]|nr:hypothetical protein GCM10010228_32570 [Streptomyces massasporeus]
MASALTGIPVGRILDRRAARAVMTTGTVQGVVAVLSIAYAPNLAVFTAAWLMAAVAMASPPTSPPSPPSPVGGAKTASAPSPAA